MPRHTTASHARAHERGFTLLEMLIVVIVLAIIFAIALSKFSGAKKSAYFNDGKTVGTAYMQAVSQYQADFANRHPPMTGPPALRWSGNNTAATQRGPLNLTGQPYLKSTPESVTAGRVGVSVNTNCGAPGAPSGATTQTAWVSVCYLAEPRFWVRVIARKNSGALWTGSGALACYMGAPTPKPSYPVC